ncbi:hypothetical protein GMOD_00010014 [Pyrenophora seminiperda CCB06]|uniref:Uncharacterized protein n=1 Tax=Pyrenophora seminiperda CCB06 TaxID=1302712 RepID=A0A3M7M1N4_9PLEO|nr:hypothetical protein GMOD_00010014 [Pyrenophora seminiperda CCB06]
MARFDNLPAELRNVIYGQLLQANGPWQQPSDNFGLFTVSKQIHDESTSYFYQHNPISIDIQTPATRTATILPPIADKHLRYLRCLTIYVTTAEANSPEEQKAAKAIALLAQIGANFEYININIRSTLSTLLNARVDDSVFHDSHPITIALRQLLESGVSTKVRFELHRTWFAPNVAKKLRDQYSTQLEFGSTLAVQVSSRTIERELTGQLIKTHLSALGLNDEAVGSGSDSSSAASTPSTTSSLVGHITSAFADLDTFVITSLGPSEDAPVDDDLLDETSQGEEGSFFSVAEMEEFEGQDELDDGEGMDLDDHDNEEDDEEMEELEAEEMDAIFGNMEEIADHSANEADLSYMTNFAPELLLQHHHLGHLL